MRKPSRSLLGYHLRAERTRLGLTQRQAAELIGEGCTAPHLAQLELGLVRNPGIKTCLAIGKAYAISIEQISAWLDGELPTCPNCGRSD